MFHLLVLLYVFFLLSNSSFSYIVPFFCQKCKVIWGFIVHEAYNITQSNTTYLWTFFMFSVQLGKITFTQDVGLWCILFFTHNFRCRAIKFATRKLSSTWQCNKIAQQLNSKVSWDSAQSVCPTQDHQFLWKVQYTLFTTSRDYHFFTK